MSYILRRECVGEKVDIKRVRAVGLPQLLNRYKHRAGLFVGMILATVLILISDNYVWDIRISGNERVTYSQLTDVLSNCGLRVGSRLSELDVDEIETYVTLRDKRVSWIAINIVGTHANVQIRETGYESSENIPVKPSNLIAARDGQIEYLELFGGNPIVRVGDTVRKGDLLVSGVWDSNHYGFLVTRSGGKVFARTKREFTVRVPFEYTKKTPTERKLTEKYLIFFSKEIKLLKKGGNEGAVCDTIECVSAVRYFNGDRLPVGIKNVYKVFYEEESLRYSNEDAMNIAYYRLSRLIDAELPEGQILSKRIDCEITDEEYILHCTVTVIEDIAMMQEFDYLSDAGN
jgi:similar to stage IV sporulation protein